MMADFDLPETLSKMPDFYEDDDRSAEENIANIEQQNREFFALLEKKIASESFFKKILVSNRRQQKEILSARTELKTTLTELAQLKERYEAAQKRIQELALEVKERSGSFTHVQSALTEELRNKKSEVEALATQLRESRLTVRELEQKTASIAVFEKTAYEMTGFSMNLEAKISAYKKALAAQKESTSKLQRMVMQARERVNAHEGLVERYRQLKTLLEKTRSELNSSLAERDQLKMDGAQRDSIIRDHDRKLQSLEEAHQSRIKELRDQLTAQFHAAEMKVAAKNDESLGLKNRIMYLENALTENQSDLSQVHNELAKAKSLVAINGDLANELEALRTESKNKSSEIDRLNADQARARQEIASLKQDLSAAKQETNAFKVKAIQFEQADILRAKAVSELAELKSRMSNLAAREQKAETYRRTLNDVKSKIEHVVREFLNQVSSAQFLQPLNDIKTFTQFEVNRIEAALRRTPVLSPERAELEQALGQLEEQKVFLSTALQRSQQQMEEQRLMLLEILRGGSLTKVPPLD